MADVRKKLIQQAVERLPAARRPRAGDHPQSRRADPRRAHLRPRSQADHRDPRSLIKGLAGDHTIILSTHILPEVEQICEQVIIISKGKLVATDSVDNLTNRLRGSESIAVAVESAMARSIATGVSSSGWSRSPGVSRVLPRESREQRLHFELESLQGPVDPRRRRPRGGRLRLGSHRTAPGGAESGRRLPATDGNGGPANE